MSENPQGERQLSSRAELALFLGPLLLGALFPLLVKADHWLFSKSVIGARGAIGIELLALLVFAVACLGSLGVGIGLWREGRRRPILVSLLAITAGVALIGFGIELGAAILYAT